METHPLKRAKEIVDEIYSVTKKVVLTGERENEEAETQYYANLMELREPLVEELSKLRSKIDQKMAASAEFSRIRKTLEDIRTMDMSHLKYIEHIRSNVQGSYKDVKQGQKLHAGYQAYSNDESGSRMFDKKQ